MEKLTAQKIKGVYIPLITPFYKGAFDGESMKKLIDSVEPFVAGYVPCLSSGEGTKLSKDQWIEVVKTVRELTDKPVIAGIKRETLNETIELANIASKLKCEAIIVPISQQNEEEIFDYLSRLSKSVSLPIIIYNTEKYHIDNIEFLLKISTIENIIGLKDSSENQEFFDQACKLRAENKLNIAILQGLENQLKDSKNSDGFLISLANIEPQLCNDVFIKPSSVLDEKVIDIFWKYNLGSANWFITLKALLYERKIINSAEEISLAIKP